MIDFNIILGSFFLLLGSLFCLTGIYGMFKFNDLFQRIHAASVLETLGSFFILFGFVFFEGFTLISFKIFFISVLLFITGPTSTYILAKIALPKNFDDVNKGEEK